MKTGVNPLLDKDGFILTRYLVHADFHAGKYFRTFIQLQSSLANGKEVPPSPVDENQLDLHQAFADVVITSSKFSNTYYESWSPGIAIWLTAIGGSSGWTQ